MMSSSAVVFKPHDYQRRAIEWVVSHERCALFLDMGLGKTAITLMALETLMAFGEVGRALVVAPKKVAETTWTDEAAKWEQTAGLRVVALTGTASQRRRALAAGGDIDVVGRDSLGWLWDETGGGEWPYDAVVLDELSSFKNPRSRRFKALKEIARRPGRIVGLTGTPAPNGLIDLWSQIWPLDFGERLGRTLTAYRERYFTPYVIPGVCTKWSLRRGMEGEIYARLGDLCLSMRADDYLALPPLIEIDRRVDLSEGERRGYESFEREMVLELEGQEVTAMSAAALMAKLGQYTSGAIYTDPPANTSWGVTTGAKVEALAEIVEAAGGPVLVFYQYRHEVPRIRGALKGRRVEVYEDGATLRRWNAGEIDVLLAHPASTAYGLNMQSGGHVIVWTTPTFNLEQYQQANARLHRQGQREPVMVYRLMVSGSVDERAAGALSRKEGEQTGLLRALSALRRAHAPAR